MIVIQGRINKLMMITRIVYGFARTTLARRTPQVFQSLQQSQFHIDERKSDLNRVVEQMYFQDEAEAALKAKPQPSLTMAEVDEQSARLKYRGLKGNVRDHKTCQDLLRYFEESGAQFQPSTYLEFLAQMNYCFTYEDNIRSSMEARRKASANRQRNLTQTENIMMPVFYTKRQVWNHEVFSALIKAISTLEDLELMLQCRRILVGIFKEVPFEIDRSLLQSFDIIVEQPLPNPLLVMCLQLISQISNSFANKQYSKDQWLSLEKCFQQEVNADTFTDYIHQNISSLLERFDYSEISSDQLLYLATYRYQTKLCPRMKAFGSIIEELLLSRIKEFTANDCIRILLSYIILRNGSSNFYSAYFWNLLRFPVEAKLIPWYIKLLSHFQDFRLAVPNTRTAQLNVRFNFGTGFSELFEQVLLAQANLSKADHETLITIAKHNYLPPNSLLANKITQIQIEAKSLYYITTLGAVAMYEYSLFIAKQTLFELERNEIAGLIDGRVDRSSTRLNTYGSRFCDSAEQLISAIWCVLLHHQRLTKPQVLEHLPLNQLILHINQILRQLNHDGFIGQGLRIKKEYVDLAKSINAYIISRGGNMFPALIDLEALYKSATVRVRGATHVRPIAQEHRLFKLEIACFTKKYEAYIERNISHGGVHFDLKFIYNGTVLLFQIIESSHYNQNMTSGITDYSFHENQSVVFLREMLEGLPYTEISFKDVVHHIPDDNLLFVESLIGIDRLPTGCELDPALFNELLDLRSIHNIKRPVSGVKNNGYVKKSTATEKQQPDLYQLSDDDS